MTVERLVDLLRGAGRRASKKAPAGDLMLYRSGTLIRLLRYPIDMPDTYLPGWNISQMARERRLTPELAHFLSLMEEGDIYDNKRLSELL